MIKYRVIYDSNTGGFIDGFEVRSLEDGKDSALQILSSWLSECSSQEERNDMIENDSVWVEEYDTETLCYETIELTDEELKSIGWEIKE